MTMTQQPKPPTPKKIKVSEGMQTIFRRENVTKNYCKISNETSQNINLTFAERGLLIFIISLPECSKDGIMWRILKDHILANTCEQEHQVNRILSGLRDKGHAVFTEWTEINGEKKTQYLFSEIAVESWAKSATTQRKKRSQRGLKAFQTMQKKGNCQLINQNGITRKPKTETPAAASATEVFNQEEKRTQNAQQFGEMVQRVINKNGIEIKVNQADKEGQVKKSILIYNFYLNKYYNLPTINWQAKTHQESLSQIISLIEITAKNEIQREPLKGEVLMIFAFMLAVCPEKNKKDANIFTPAYIATTFAKFYTNFKNVIVARLKQSEVQTPPGLREEFINSYRTYFDEKTRTEIEQAIKNKTK